MKWRIWHGCHTKAEPQPPERVTLSIPQLVSCLQGWFQGEWGLTKHSRMPQELSASGVYSLFFELLEIWSEKRLGFTLVGSLESNIHREKGRFYLDGNPQGFDVHIASIHTTPECGWDGGGTPEEFLEAYRATMSKYASFPKRFSLGHVMFYAQGENWTNCYVEVLKEAASTNVGAGIFLGKTLRRKDNWEEADLYHPTEGLTVLQPWALPLVQELPELKLTLDWDGHLDEDLRGLTEANMRTLQRVLIREEIYSHFVV